jgi:hypothetical protein
MFKSLIPAFALITACASSVPSPVPPSNLSPAPAAAVPAAATNAASRTYSDKNWSIVVPYSMVRQETSPDDPGSFDALDKEHRMTMFIQVQEAPVSLDQAAKSFAMSLASKDIDVLSIKPISWVGKDALEITSSKSVASGTLHFYSWATVSNGSVYHFGCIAMPKADVSYAERTCRETAETVKFNWTK